MTTSSSKSWFGPWIWQALLIVVAGLWIFAPALRGTWLMDDALYLPEHPLLHDPARLWKTWFAPGSFLEYYPIGETLQYIQWRLWGVNTLCYHLSNVLLHIANGLLVWRLLSQFGLRLAWIGGLLFVIHPVQVESVAWIAEFKNCVSLLPFLLTMSLWIDYEEYHRHRDYALAFGFFVVAMLCKIGMAPFPFVILLYAWWKRGRVSWSDVKGMLPFLAVGVVLLVTTTWSSEWFLQSHHSDPESIPPIGIPARIALGGLSLAFYLSQFFWPIGLSPIYPLWTIDPTRWQQFLPWPVFLAVAVWFWSRRETWGRHVLLGLGFFTLMIAPFLGFNSVSYHSFTWVMDHFLYIPVIGLIGLIVAVLDQISVRIIPGLRLIGGIVVAITLLTLTWQSHLYAATFVDSEASNRHAIALYPGTWTAHNNLGNALRKEGHIAEAMDQFREAARLRSNYALPRNNLAGLLVQSGHYPEAIAQYQAALAIQPDYPQALNGLGNALVLSGKVPDALPYYQAALKSAPDYAEAHNSLGNALLQLGRLDEARTECEKSIGLNPDIPESHCTLGLVLVQTGDLKGALEQFEIASHLAPGNAHIQQGLEWLRGLQQARGNQP